MQERDTYGKLLDQGEEFQDLVCHNLMRLGISFYPYTSHRWQCEHGESANGIEVKHDMRLKETGNLYIEVAERRSEQEFVPSGIMGDSWLFLIGDYERLYVFSTYQLQRCYQVELGGVPTVTTKTSKGFLLGPSERQRLSLRKPIKLEQPE